MIKNKIGIEPQKKYEESSWWIRLGWLFTIWTISVLALAVIAFLIRKLMTAAGMSV